MSIEDQLNGITDPELLSIVVEEFVQKIEATTRFRCPEKAKKSHYVMCCWLLARYQAIVHDVKKLERLRARFPLGMIPPRTKLEENMDTWTENAEAFRQMLPILKGWRRKEAAQ